MGAQVGTIIKKSALYETEALGPPAPDYLNRVLWVSTTLSAHSLLDACLRIEHQLGRQQRKKWAPRAIDIDILYYGATSIRSETLRIPHPELAERRFVLVPMVEIAPYFIHPELKKTQEELLHSLKGLQRVRAYKGE